MRRIALLALPLFILTACERGLPTAAEITESPVYAVSLVLDGEGNTVNLYTASTVQVVIPSVSTVPATATLTNDDNGAVADPLHTFDAGCDTHFQDLTGDLVPDLVLHFDAAILFGSYGSVPPLDEEQPIALTLYAEWQDADGNPIDTYDATYSVTLFYSEPAGFRGGR